MTRKVEENQKILRRYIRLLSHNIKTLEADKALNFFITLHNFLSIEDKFYNQCLAKDKQINNHLNLIENTMFVPTVLAYYRQYFDPIHKIRYSLETMDSIEDVSRFLIENIDVYTQLKLKL